MFLPSFSLFLFALFFLWDHPAQFESKPTDSDSSTSKMPSNPNPLTSHVLDTAIGRPAAGVRVILSKQGSNGGWDHVSEQLTNADGRIGNIIPGDEFTRGIYKLHFDTLGYYQARGERTFYPYIEVVFEIENPEEHFHVPILLSAYGYSTYRGS